MNYPQISEYIEAIKMAEENFNELTYLRPVLDENGEPIMSSGNFAVVFKMKDERTGKLYAVKCFLREQKDRRNNYKLISKELKSVSVPYLLQFNYYEKELFVDSTVSSNSEFDILLMDWIDGVTLEEYLKRNQRNTEKIKQLSEFFRVFSVWLLSQRFAHGDIKPDNIIVNLKTDFPVLVDYDGMYVPSMKGKISSEVGSPDYSHPKRTVFYFNEHIDDFSLTVIQLYIDTVLANSKLSKPFDLTCFVLRKADFINLKDSKTLKLIAKLFYYDYHIISSYQRLLELLKPNYNSNERLKDSSKVYVPHLSFVSIAKIIESIDDNYRVWYDCFGVKYTEGWKRLLCFPSDLELKEYTIHEQCEEIGDYAFEADADPSEWTVYYYGNKLKKLILPNSVKTIEEHALEGCFDLVKIVLPESLKSIGDSAFLNCKSLKHILLPSSIKTIGINVFPENLISIKIDSNKFISKRNCFYSLDGVLYWVNRHVVKIDVPEGIRIIRSGALSFCSKLTEIVFPSTLEKIDGPGLPESISIVKSNSSHILSNNNCVYSSEGELLWVNKDIHYFSFPKEIRAIGQDAFDKCSELQNLTIPNTISSISQHIGMCDNLDWIYLPESINEIAKDSLRVNYGQGKYYSTHFPKIFIPTGTRRKFELLENSFSDLDCNELIEVDTVMTASSLLPEDDNLSLNADRCVYHQRFYGDEYSRIVHYGNTYLDSYSIKNGTEVICDYCFDDMYSEFDDNYLSKLVIPSSVQIIGTDAFCSSIEDIICESPFFIVKNQALFSEDGKVFYRYFGKNKHYIIPDGVETIVGGAFTKMVMESIVIPETVKEIGNNPFAGIINNLDDFCEEINLQCNSPFFEIRQDCLIDKNRNHLIAYLKDKDKINLDGISSIGANAFYSKNIKKVEISSPINYIDKYAFGWCFKLKSVLVPKNDYTIQCKISNVPYLEFGEP